MEAGAAEVDPAGPAVVPCPRPAAPATTTARRCRLTCLSILCVFGLAQENRN